MLKQKLFIILCFSIILTSVDSQIYKYACADELEQGGVCYLESTTKESTDPTSKEVTIYVKKCGKGKTCESADTHSLGGCSKDESNELGEEDDKCKVNEECYSQNCVSGKCKYAADGENCKREEDCKPTSYCSSDNKCKAIPKAGEQCDDNEDEPCMNGYICGKTGSEAELKCIEKYSVQDGTVVSRSDLCKSGQSDDNNKCVSYTRESTECDSSDECSYKIGDNTSVKLSGYCQLKSDGKTNACREINGKLWNKYVEAYGKRLKKIKDDKDFNRHSSKWREHLGDRDISDAYVEWYNNVFFSDASKCIKDYFKQEAASSNFIVFNVMLIISFTLILI